MNDANVKEVTVKAIYSTLSRYEYDGKVFFAVGDNDGDPVLFFLDGIADVLGDNFDELLAHAEDSEFVRAEIRYTEDESASFRAITSWGLLRYLFSEQTTPFKKAFREFVISNPMRDIPLSRKLSFDLLDAVRENVDLLRIYAAKLKTVPWYHTGARAYKAELRDVVRELAESEARLRDLKFDLRV